MQKAKIGNAKEAGQKELGSLKATYLFSHLSKTKFPTLSYLYMDKSLEIRRKSPSIALVS